MATMKEFAREGKSILFISHKLNEIMEVSDRVTVLRKGKCIGTVNTCDTDKQALSNMMVGRPVQLEVVKGEAHPGESVLQVSGLCVRSRTHKRDAVHDVSFTVRKGRSSASPASTATGRVSWSTASPGWRRARPAA